MKKQMYEIVNFLASLFVITAVALITAYLVSNKIDEINEKSTEKKESKTEFVSEKT